MDSLFGDDDIDLKDEIEEIEGDMPAGMQEEGNDTSPRETADLFGHGDIEAALLEDFHAHRLPHAFILAGPEGIGKATLAYRLARFLFAQSQQAAGLFGEDEKPATLHIAPDHPVFRRVASGGHADLMVVEREFDEKKGKLKKNISAELARSIAPFLRKTAAEGGWRVVIVDGAEDFNDQSQNALLKILEEPPEKTVLILTSTRAGAFLPTIRSRCRTIQMKPLRDDIVGSLLEQRIPSLMQDEKLMLMRLCRGSIGRALRFHADQGAVLYKSLLAVLSDMPQINIPALHDLAEKIGRGTSEDGFFMAQDILLQWCERLVQAEARGCAIEDILPGDAIIFQRIFSVYPPGHFLSVWEKMGNLFSQVNGLNLDKRQALISAFLMLSQPEYQAISA